MSLFFNSKLIKSLKYIFPVVKYNISTDQAIELPNSKQSVQTSNQQSNRINATKSIIFGFSFFVLLEVEETDPNRQLVETIKRGLLYLKNGDYNVFEQTLRDALKMAYDLQNSNCITHIYDVLANGAFMNKEYGKAIHLFIKVIKLLMDQGYRADDINVLYLNLKLSKIYEVQKDYKNCELNYIYCLQHLEKKFIIDPKNKGLLDLYVKTLDAYGRYLMKLGQIKTAKIILKKAYQVNVKLRGKISEKNVVLLSDLGNLCNIQGNLNKAIYYLKKAEKIGQRLPNIKILSAVYINIGKVYLKQGILKKANKNIKEGLRNAKRQHYSTGKKEAKKCLAKINKAMMQRLAGRA